MKTRAKPENSLHCKQQKQTKWKHSAREKRQKPPHTKLKYFAILRQSNMRHEAKKVFWNGINFFS